MTLVDGIHHLTILTADMDRLIAFYQRVFDARVVLDLEEEGLRHAFIELGPETLLHPFQMPGVEVPQGAMPIFGRGRLDHFGLNAASLEAFRELRDRAVAEGSSDGEVTDIGPHLSFSFTDPDGAEHEVLWNKPGVPIDASVRRANWTTVDLD
ncbi:MAG: VOC family protein [Chloroflexota bacterium]|nr:VOC family protein [Chloroflexota bacterium]